MAFWRNRKQPESEEQPTPDDEPLIELEVVGEGPRQDELARIAGPKSADEKMVRVGVALRCEPSNPYDPNAIRVEVMGQHVGYVSRTMAAAAGPAILATCNGCLEARGIIVGGWLRARGDEGSYGIRVWITERDVARLGLRIDDIDPRTRAKWPDLALPAPDEQRISPTQSDLAAGIYGSALTVTCEEHYQSEIIAIMPPDWQPERSWPLLVELVLGDCNPHAKAPEPCIEVRCAAGRIGYLTSKMTARYAPTIRSCSDANRRVTAAAIASRADKGGQSIWRVKVSVAE